MEHVDFTTISETAKIDKFTFDENKLTLFLSDGQVIFITSGDGFTIQSQIEIDDQYAAYLERKKSADELDLKINEFNSLVFTNLSKEDKISILNKLQI